jgi:NAD(P)-dependent dehydrogenase (short-subunit alcohol dehydrogenase family)
MEGKVCLVMGAHTGIGYAMAVGLAERGAAVMILCRDEERGHLHGGPISRSYSWCS